MAEVDYFLRDQRPAMRAWVADIFDPASRYEFEPASPSEIARALELDARFADLNLGLVDCVVAAVCERRAVLRVLTTDRNHFAAIRIGAKLETALTLVP
jgi:predicted nucleic acid-binding protein